MSAREYGKLLVILGLGLVGIGGLLWGKGDWGLLGRLGRLPGDFSFQREGVSFYFPLTTCVLLSLVLTLLAWLLRR